MKPWTVTEAARNFSDLVSRVYYQGESAILTKGGKPVAKIISARRAKTGREAAVIWASLPPWSAEEGEAFAEDIETGISHLPPPISKWD